ncbi:MAG: helix-turn-helix transcriptional regulator [Clostridia bacterium]|jgi:transcriptional regulator with XRE-family HTH domain|nr:helix-turn-helix transcriptional regulator [Clostridia bacterium]
MELSVAIRIRITNLIKEHNLTTSKLCTLAGISRSTLSKFLSGKRNIIKLSTIEYICEALNIKLTDFFNDSLFNDIFINEKN